MKKRIKATKTITAENAENDVRIRVHIEVNAGVNALNQGEVSRMIESLTDSAMMAVGRCPYGNVSLSQMKIV